MCCFHEIFVRLNFRNFHTVLWYHTSVHCTLCILQKFTLALFWQKFRENDVSTNKITKQLNWRIFFFGESKFFILPHCGYENTVRKMKNLISLKKFVNFFKKTVTFTNILPSERPKRPKSVSAETEISAKLTETSAEISAEILPKITWN